MALDYNIIGNRIKQARLAKNYTQEDLAEKIDISVAFRHFFIFFYCKKNFFVLSYFVAKMKII